MILEWAEVGYRCSPMLKINLHNFQLLSLFRLPDEIIIFVLAYARRWRLFWLQTHFSSSFRQSQSVIDLLIPSPVCLSGISMSLYLLLTKPKGGSQLQHSPFNSFYANMTLTNRQLITIFPLLQSSPEERWTKTYPWHWVCTQIHWAFLCWSSQTNDLILFVSIHPTIPQVNSK